VAILLRTKAIVQRYSQYFIAAALLEFRRIRDGLKAVPYEGVQGKGRPFRPSPDASPSSVGDALQGVPRVQAGR
jgi:hypothetical protein